MADCKRCGQLIVGKRPNARFCGGCVPRGDRSGELSGVERDAVRRVGGKLGVDAAVLRGLSESDRQAVLLELREVDRAFRRNPLLGYVPHPKQVKFHGAIGLDLRAYFGGNRCLPAGTLVRMADGSARAIELVEPGDWVVGSSPEGDTRPVRVLYRFDNGLREVSRFWFGKRGEELFVDATDTHEFAGRKECEGPSVAPLWDMAAPRTRSRWSVARSLGWDLPAGEDEELATLFGLMLGDGCLTGKHVAFTSADDDVTALFEGELAKVGCRASRSSANPIQFVAATAVATEPKVHARLLRERFREHGLCCYAHQKSIPAVCWSWSSDAIARLAAGLILTDGSVWCSDRNEWHVAFTSTSRALADGLRRLLAERLGIYGSTLMTNDRPDKNRPEYNFTIGTYESLRRLYERVPLVGRKRDTLAGALENWSGKRSDASLLRYRGREPLGVLPTHDLSVDHEDHLFVLANGLVTHNSGKTTAGVLDCLMQTVDDEFLPEHLKDYRRFHPPFYCRVVTPDLSNTLEGVILQKIREWCPPEQIRGGAFEKGYDKVLRVLHFKNGSWWQFNSNDQELNKLGGTALHRSFYDEEPREDIRRECLMRTLDYGGDEVFAMTPLMGLSWTYEDVYEPWKRGLLPPGTVTISSMEENPHLDPKDIERVLAGLSSEERQARQSGRFVHFAGLIYQEWSSERHVIPAWEDVPLGEVYVGIDPGIRHPAGVLWCHLDDEDVLTAFDELNVTGQTVGDVCRQIHEKNARWGITPRWYVIDPAARNKNHQTGRSDQQEYAEHGVVCIPGQNAVTAGINRVKERLQADPVRFRATANCREFRRQMGHYRWSRPKRIEGDPKESPVKTQDDLVDPARYVCAQRPLAPDRPAFRENVSMKDRLMRELLKEQGLGRVEHDSGPGIFA